MFLFRKFQAILLLAALVLPFMSSAQTSPEPSGSIEISSKSIAVGIGVNWGEGTLTTNGKDYKFSISGLSIADLGVSKITARGEVFNLKNPSDLSGNYVAGAAGLAVADGEDGLVMKNKKGVVLRIHGVEKGIRFQLGAQGVSIKLQ
jgi:hypothetical protein